MQPISERSPLPECPSPMPGGWKGLLERLRPPKYGRKPPLILLNGLAEQHESWYRNIRFWHRFFDVHMPHILAYEGDWFQKRMRSDDPISVDYLVEELYQYVTRFVQRPPYHIVSSSLGGKIAVEFAVKYPDLVNRLILICPSGMGDVERLPIMDGVRRNDYNAVVKSVFHRPRRAADRGLLNYYRRCFESRPWKLGLIRTVKGTNEHTVRSQIPQLSMPTLIIGAKEDKIVDYLEGEKAAMELPDGYLISIPKCGHAPQIEKPWLVNRLVAYFLTSPTPGAHPSIVKLLSNKPTRVPT